MKNLARKQKTFNFKPVEFVPWDFDCLSKKEFMEKFEVSDEQYRALKRKLRP